MDIQSLGYRTDLIFPKFDGQILDRGDYLVILTPTNPTYYWGNFLLFPKPPKGNDLENWKAIFSKEIGSQINAEHFTFGWDTIVGDLGEIKPFLDAGFDLSQSVVLSTQEVKMPTKYNQEAVIRPLTDNLDWEQATQNQIACRDPEHTFEDYQIFKRDQMKRYRLMAKAGMGLWFGAFLGKKLVADLGVFATEDIGRFQNVGTHPNFRRLGICGALVYEASCYAFEYMKIKTLVMVADEHYHAAKIYESVGFQPKEHQAGLTWWDKSKS
ncbi:MAG: GNAT family N-acetyltransferase [Anaerolineae bacterium]|jgi:ribosomal protein S18 acetylase RimI-like enzyme|nr:GNAT family N-acetyltransferase [Anaerolineae bacterium]MBT7075480.1 GNAT family N-acetyltransferase [Anaerolineae bacterium]MBT7781545.1 GNAT family N-acetyltransferase [Anaerolineae bacterium]